MEQLTTNENLENITKEKLISFAEEKPPRDPEVEKMLLQWLDETRIQESQTTPSMDYLNISIMHSAMKYRLGFLSKEEVLQELEDVRIAMTAEKMTSKPAEVLYDELSQLMYDIEDDVFDKITANN